MATVSNPASMSSVVATFGGPGNLTAYTRGGSYVPNVAMNNAIATTSGSLALSQFNGATTFSASAAPALSSRLVSTNYTNGTSNTFVCTVVGGTSTTYSWTVVSGPGIINSPTSSSTTVTAQPGASSGSTTIIHCTAKDVNGATTVSNNVQFDVSSTA